MAGQSSEKLGPAKAEADRAEGSLLTRAVLETVGQQKADLVRFATASGEALTELAAQRRAAEAATARHMAELAQQQSATETTTASHLAELAQQRRATAAATASHVAELAQQQQRAAAAATSNVEVATRSFAASQQQQAHSMNQQLNALGSSVAEQLRTLQTAVIELNKGATLKAATLKARSRRCESVLRAR